MVIREKNKILERNQDKDERKKDDRNWGEIREELGRDKREF